MLFVAWPVQADDPIVGEIRIWAGTGDPPDGWLVCDGQTLSRSSYTSLFSILGTTYGNTTDYNFRVPDTEGAVVVGQADFGTNFDALGETGGEISHTLTVAEMPSHRHADDRGVTAGSSWSNGAAYYALAPNLGTTGGALASTYTGGDGAHNNLQPYLVLNYIIFTGVYQNPTPTPTATATSIPGGATGPLTGTITGSLVISQALPSYAFTQTLTTGNEFVFLRSASYGEVIAGSGALLLLFGVIFWFVARSTRRSGD